MCHLCLSNGISRRTFLHGMLLSGLAAAAAACSSNQEPGLIDSRSLTTPTVAGFPHLAGPVTAVSPQGITLSGDVGTRQVRLGNETLLLNVQGQRTKTATLDPGKTVLVWLDPVDPGMAAVLQPLPSISATQDPIPVVDGQTNGTGESRPFGNLSLITRAGWGAATRHWVSNGESGLYDPVSNQNGWLVYDDPLSDHLHTAIVHHSALEFSDGPRAVQALHMKTARYADVGYHFLIDGLGQLFEGRPVNVRGAHTGGFNTGYIGICLLGNFEVAPPIVAQINTLSLLLAVLKNDFGIGRLGGHRDFNPGITVCPGANLHPQLRVLSEENGLILSHA